MRPHLVRTLTVALVTGLVLTLLGCGAVGGAVRAGVAPEFEQQIALDAHYTLVIHNRQQSGCTALSNLPEPYLIMPGPACRVLSVYAVTPHGGRVLVWFRLPE